MAARGIIAWSAGAAVVCATAAVAASALVGLPTARPSAVSAASGAVAVSDWPAAPAPPGPLAGLPDPVIVPVAELPPVQPIDAAVLSESRSGQELRAATTPTAVFGPPSGFLAFFSLRPALGASPGFDRFGPARTASVEVPARLAVPPPSGSPAAIVRQEVAARDVTVARASVLPPPRPVFLEAALAPGSETIREVVLESGPVTAWPNAAEAPGDEPHARSRPERTLGSGMASWYGPGFHGRRTASGEVFNQNDLTAAHRHLPFGTRVRVVDQKTGRSIVVRINDRGPFAHGRVIDLSKASAKALGMDGLSRVKIVSAD